MSTAPFGFYGFSMIGGNVYADIELTQRLTALEQLQAGMHVYATGPMGETRRFLVDSVTVSDWSGRDEHMLVSGWFQPDRYQDVVGKVPGGWVAAVFGDGRALARVDFA